MVEQEEKLSPEVEKILQEEEALGDIETAIDAAYEEGIDVTPKEVIEILKETESSSEE